MPNVVAVEQHRMHTLAVQVRLQRIGDRRFPGAAETGEPDHLRTVPLDRSACVAIDGGSVPGHVAPPGGGDHRGADGA